MLIYTRVVTCWSKDGAQRIARALRRQIKISLQGEQNQRAAEAWSTVESLLTTLDMNQTQVDFTRGIDLE